MRRVRSIPLLSLLYLAIVIVCALAGPAIAPFDPSLTRVHEALMPPSFAREGSMAHWLGTDHLGRDVLSRLIYGARASVAVALMAMALSGVIGTILGIVAGYFGSHSDTVISRIADIWLSMPAILVAIALVAVLGAGLESVILAYVLLNWVYYTRVIRAQTLIIRNSAFIDAAVSIGAPSRMIITRHIVPNVAGPIIVLATLDVGRAIVFESSLSFLGLGLQPPNSSWGLMLSEARQYMLISWWLPTFPGLAITLTVLSANFVGDWLRDISDPKRGAHMA